MDRNICCPTKPNIPKELWEFIKKIPALRYMLAPVEDVEDLYKKYNYQDTEPNNFAYVSKENTFYVWRECEEHYEHYSWQPVKADFLDFLFDIDYSEISDGDILVFNEELNKYINASFNLFGEIEWTEDELNNITNG